MAPKPRHRIPDALDEIFNGGPDELELSETITDEYSSEASDYNLAFDFDEQLRAIPENRKDFEAFAAVLVARSRLAIEELHTLRPAQARPDDHSDDDPPETETYDSSAPAEVIVSSLGQAGALQNILGDLELAELYLSSALEFADSFDCSGQNVMQQFLRYLDVKRLNTEFEAAESGFKSALAQIKTDASLEAFTDFALQHLGKVYFDKGLYSQAEKYFEDALELRQKNKNRDLVASTEHALERTRALKKLHSK